MNNPIAVTRITVVQMNNTEVYYRRIVELSVWYSELKGEVIGAEAIQAYACGDLGTNPVACEPL